MVAISGVATRRMDKKLSAWLLFQASLRDAWTKSSQAWLLFQASLRDAWTRSSQHGCYFRRRYATHGQEALKHGCYFRRRYATHGQEALKHGCYFRRRYATQIPMRSVPALKRRAKFNHHYVVKTESRRSAELVRLPHFQQVEIRQSFHPFGDPVGESLHYKFSLLHTFQVVISPELIGVGFRELCRTGLHQLPSILSDLIQHLHVRWGIGHRRSITRNNFVLPCNPGCALRTHTPTHYADQCEHPNYRRQY